VARRLFDADVLLTEEHERDKKHPDRIELPD
jgi:hypothetical protein